MLFHHQQTRRGKEMEFREEREQAELKRKNPLYKKSMKCEGPEQKADYRSFSQVLRLELLFLRNLVRPFFTLFYKLRGFPGGHGKRLCSRRNKGLLCERDVREDRRKSKGKKKVPIARFAFPPVRCCSETKPYFVQMMALK